MFVCNDIQPRWYNVGWLSVRNRTTLHVVFLMNCFVISALIPVSEEVRSNLRPGDQTDPDSPILPCPCKLENSRNAGSETSLDSQVSIVITTSSSPRPDDNPSDRAFVWPTECQNMLLNPGVVNDSQTQALLLTTLVSVALLCSIAIR